MAEKGNVTDPFSLLEYQRLGSTDTARQAAYRQLFEHHIPDTCVNAIREATNKAWVLGSDRFKERIQQQLARRVEPATRGGDRKSERFKLNSKLQIHGI